ncbi:DMT family transporter [Pyrobaculum sp. 3827-6]|uniref:DMT family transporter n=1 Tax=Pyrobaculum sp. 3827-6 TaxID=2983604 RepID=UPI0021D8D010|nr:DMT family transporter [Pyrobaculum sp. 3827-6]MCU7786391.1 DMT family transporter [Pyrobaculum sp. 3827-6]
MKLGVLEMVVVTALWGSVPVVAIYSGLPAPVFVFFRISIAACVLWLLLKTRLVLDLHVALSGVFLALNWILLFYAVRLVTVSEAVLLYYTGPIFAMLAAHLLGMRLTPTKALAAALAFTGVALTVAPSFSHAGAGAAVALASGAAYGGLIVTNKYASAKTRPLDLVFNQAVYASVITSPFLVITHVDITPTALAAILFASIVNTLLALALWYDALKKLDIHLAAVLSYLDPVFATVFGYIFLGQTPPPSALLGGTLIITAGAISTIEGRRRLIQRT